MAKMALPRTPRMPAPRMHVMVSVHSTGPRDVARASRPCGSRPELALSQAKGWPCHELGESTEPEWERTKPESFRKHEACKNISSTGERAGRNPNGSDGATALGRVFRAIKTALVPRKECSQLPLFQTKPECYRKEAAYKNVSKARVWLGKAMSFLSEGELPE